MITQKIIKFTLSIFFIITLLILPFNSINNVNAFNNTESHPANSLWIEPSRLKINDRNDKFNVTIWINLNQNSFAWQIKLNFKSTFFNATRIGYTNGNRSQFFSEYSTVPIIPKIDNENGYILHGETLLGSDEKTPGYGSLIWVEFEVVNASLKNILTFNFSQPYGVDTFVLSPYLDIIPLDSINGMDISLSLEPPIPLYIVILVIIVIIVVTAFIVLIIMRRKKRTENHE